jgi:hypothetical protein
MDISELEAACQNVVATAKAREIGNAATDGEWGSPSMLAHLVAANRGVSELVARVLAGAESPPFTNRGALQGSYLDAVIQAAGPAGVLGESSGAAGN